MRVASSRTSAGPFGCWTRCERSSAYRLGPELPRRVRPRPISGKMCQFVPFCATPYLSGVPTVAQNVIPVCHGILWIVGESAPRRGSTRAGSIYLLASACHEDRVARVCCSVQWPLRRIERPWHSRHSREEPAPWRRGGGPCVTPRTGARHSGYPSISVAENPHPWVPAFAGTTVVQGSLKTGSHPRRGAPS